ncbi:exo-alpha-sialidase [Microbacterium sp. NEAU-LLC]|uniref:exo-alpha-sialidase n=1 Tax=Microbacterium helvum TaxID=2773713 RepID=A0ABR8NTC8_9MICO|nr:exo-alpha-sialidase [Microbacterium helvum]MBD3943879.1 exo-alpha-sialidase [Microbacterium helvum]
MARLLPRFGIAVPALIVALTLGGGMPALAASTPDYLNDPTDPPDTYAAQNLAADRTAENFFYRIPTIAHLGEGVVVAAWDARPGSAGDSPNPNSIIQRRSTDNGVTWGPLQIIAAGHVADATAPRHGYSDPSYVYDRETGRLFAFFVYSKDQGFGGSAYGNDDADRQVISSAVIQSDDGGLTWSEPRLITDVTKTATGTTVDGRYIPVAGDIKGNFATSGGGIQLRYGEHAGRLIQQYAGTVLLANGSTAIQAYSVYSDDHGATWHKGANVGTGMDENKVVELSDGRVMLNSRDSSNGRLRKIALSDDGGATYGPVTADADLPDPTNNAAIVRLHPDAAQGSADAQRLLFVNSNNGANGSRVNGAVRVSCDDGQTWPGLRTIDTGSFAYASAAVLDDGRVGVLWERNYTNDMQLSTFDETWLNYVCAPLSAPAQQATAGASVTVPVTVTNQEQAPLTGDVTFFTPTGWTATTAHVTALAPDASVTVEVAVTTPADGQGTQNLQAAFTASDGRLSQSTTAFRLPAPLGATLTSTLTSPSRDVVASPYQVGDVLAYTVRVVSTSDVVTTVTPNEANFTSGFLPTACRWQNLPARDAYNCTTPRHTITADDLARGWYAPEFSFTVAPPADPSAGVTVSYTGAAIALRDGVLDAAITGSRGDTGRDLASDPYRVGEQLPYTFRVDNASALATTVTPTAGAFAPFVPPGAGNCRFQNLAGGAGYTCATAKHTVTQDDVDRGFFDATTTWSLTATGQSAKTVAVAAAEVDVVARAPQLGGTVSGTWNDVNGDGVATIGDTVTFTASVANTGNVRLDGVTAGDLSGVTLAAGAAAQIHSSTVVVTAEHLAAGAVAAPSFDATASNGSRAVEAGIAGAAVALPVPAAWGATTAYDTGDRVVFDGRQWVAAWWTKAQGPGDPWGAWQEYASDESAATVWTASRIFDTGDVVVHDGRTFTAKWWTRNQTPGAKNGPWAVTTG